MSDLTLRLVTLAEALRAEVEQEQADKRDILLSHGCLLQDVAEAKSQIAERIAELSDYPDCSPEKAAMRAYREVLAWLP